MENSCNCPFPPSTFSFSSPLSLSPVKPRPAAHETATKLLHSQKLKLLRAWILRALLPLSFISSLIPLHFPVSVFLFTLSFPLHVLSSSLLQSPSITSSPPLLWPSDRPPASEPCCVLWCFVIREVSGWHFSSLCNQTCCSHWPDQTRPDPLTCTQYTGLL